MDKRADYAAPAWMKLDNAAKIYPPTRSRNWAAMFRLSVTLTEPIDVAVLARAQRAAMRRVPTFSYCLRRGVFWYYMERMEGAPEIQQDVANPLVRMDLNQNGRFMFRTRYHGSRIAVEVFHALTDGTGALVFLLTMTAEYLRLKYGADIPPGDRILDVSQPPDPAELEDSFLRYARGLGLSRREAVAYTVPGTDDVPHYLNITTGIVEIGPLAARAKEMGVSITALLAAALIQSVQRVQLADPSKRMRRRPIKVSIPVNLRPYYGARTMRNFASYVNVGINSALGEHTFEETLRQVKHAMGMEITEKVLNARVSANVNAERHPVLRGMPLFVKSPFMKLMFKLQGDRYCTTTISNLGLVQLPPAMEQYVTRVELVLGTPSDNPVICGCAGYRGRLY
ncbi:MAG: hypothetical protein GX558_00535, partial [Clostridiales bacterium]|nr:hypothetical protein [Clostridiales bacterium]